MVAGGVLSAGSLAERACTFVAVRLNQRVALTLMRRFNHKFHHSQEGPRISRDQLTAARQFILGGTLEWGVQFRWISSDIAKPSNPTHSPLLASPQQHTH